MNIDQIKSNITTCYMMFVFDFADPSIIDRERLEDEIGLIKDVFNNQKNTDYAKKILGKAGFPKVLALYFSQFKNKDGVDHEALEQELIKNKKVFLRHLGKDKVNYLSLIVKVMSAIHEKKKGLLLREPA